MFRALLPNGQTACGRLPSKRQFLDLRRSLFVLKSLRLLTMPSKFIGLRMASGGSMSI
jgi:hypothetical protein